MVCARVLIIFMIALGAVTLITTLFLRLQLSRNHAESNTLRLLGFSARQLTLQTMAQLGLMILVGIGSGLPCCHGRSMADLPSVGCSKFRHYRTELHLQSRVDLLCIHS